MRLEAFPCLSLYYVYNSVIKVHYMHVLPDAVNSTAKIDHEIKGMDKVHEVESIFELEIFICSGKITELQPCNASF